MEQSAKYVRINNLIGLSRYKYAYMNMMILLLNSITLKTTRLK